MTTPRLERDEGYVLHSSVSLRLFVLRRLFYKAASYG